MKNSNFEVLHTVEFLPRLPEAGKAQSFTPRWSGRSPTTIPAIWAGPAAFSMSPGDLWEPSPVWSWSDPRNREYSRCCGAGGGLKAGYPDIQNKMAQRRVQEAEATGAEELISACPCYAGLQVGIKALDSPLIMRDVSYLVEASLKRPEVVNDPIEAMEFYPVPWLEVITRPTRLYPQMAEGVVKEILDQFLREF